MTPEQLEKGKDLSNKIGRLKTMLKEVSSNGGELNIKGIQLTSRDAFRSKELHETCEALAKLELTKQLEAAEKEFDGI